jgi:glyoxylase-like metal-dependent hydrolase (beta-lactamase superfamily II)
MKLKATRYETVTQLTTFPGVFPVNCYLVEEENSLTLVDAALPLSAEGIIRQIGTMGKPLAHIVLTHAHEDHVGALDRIKRSYPDAQVAISRRDAALMAGKRELHAGEANAPIRGGVPKKLRTQPDILLEEGDTIGSLRAMAAPGHTPGLFAFMDERNNALIAGDAMQTFGGVAVAGQVKWRFPFPAFGTWHAETALNSAKKLLQCRPALLAIGHGDMLVKPEAAMAAAIEEAERKLAKEAKHGA